MRAPRFPDVPPRATLLVVVLVLLASVVMGAPWTGTPPTSSGTAMTAPANEAGAPSEPLDIERLERKKTVGMAPDLFKYQAFPPAGGLAARSAVAAIPPPPPPVPIAPPLRLKYLGRMSDGGRTVVFLEAGQNLYSVAVGDTVESVYRVQAIADSSVTFRYMPLGQDQTLPIPAQP
jgi:hypothetical protein